MRKSDLILGFFALLVVSSLVAKGIHIVVSGDEPKCLQNSKK